MTGLGCFARYESIEHCSTRAYLHMTTEPKILNEPQPFNDILKSSMAVANAFAEGVPNCPCCPLDGKVAATSR